jgi:hypothetical protein
MKKLYFFLATLLVFATFSASGVAARRCFRSYWIWMGNERVQVCCASGVCTTKYGYYGEDK